jgi:hypothetical protein
MSSNSDVNESAASSAKSAGAACKLAVRIRHSKGDIAAALMRKVVETD